MEVIRRQPDTKRGPAEWFTGDVYIDEISPGPHVKLLSVHFTPGARTAWHVHPFGQLIHVTEGLGLFQVRGEPVQPLRAGDTVRFDSGEVHWHGAGPTTFMTFSSRSTNGIAQPPRNSVEAMAANAPAVANSPMKNSRKRSPEYSVM